MTQNKEKQVRHLTWSNKSNYFSNTIGTSSIFQFWYTSLSTNLHRKALIECSSVVWIKSFGRASSFISTSASSICPSSWQYPLMWISVMPDLITFVDLGKDAWNGGMASSSSSSCFPSILASLIIWAARL